MKPKRVQALLYIFWPFLLNLALSGCGSSDNTSKTASNVEVTEVGIDDSSLVVNQDSAVSIDFDYDKSSVLDFGQHVAIAVRLPAGLRFQDGTAKIQGARSDFSISAGATVCENGESYISFDLDREELSFADEVGNSSNRIIFGISAVTAEQNATIVAGAAFNGIPFGCNLGLSGNAARVIQING